MQVIQDGGRPIKAWIEGVELEDSARAQLVNIAKMPFIYKHVAVMPDVHWGMGATIGSVIATKGAVIPAAVGVDLGCGMMAQRTTLKASQLPYDLGPLRSAIEAAIPHGRTDNGGDNDRGAWHKVPAEIDSEFYSHMVHYLIPKGEKLWKRAAKQLGTLGTGNHFIEVCLDEEQRVWIMLHSGSRGVGNILASEYIAKAKQLAAKYYYEAYLADKDLAFLPEGTPEFKEYVEAIEWAQNYALVNRRFMMDAALGAVKKTLDNYHFGVEAEVVNCHHNYLSRESHFKENVLVTRKGAVRARSGDLGIIAGSMGAKSFIVRGKGNPDSFMSCSHGAGRRMGRNEAKNKITMERFAETMIGVESRRDAEVLDEAPDAYKDIDAVIAAQSDLIDVVHTLKQVVCVKG
jgi:tRNA-splicing ligase RtcB